MSHDAGEGAIHLSLFKSESQFYIVILNEKTEYKGYAIKIFHGE
jgi:hypothetical protein